MYAEAERGICRYIWPTRTSKGGLVFHTGASGRHHQCESPAGAMPSASSQDGFSDKEAHASHPSCLMAATSLPCPSAHLGRMQARRDGCAAPARRAQLARWRASAGARRRRCCWCRPGSGDAGCWAAPAAGIMSRQARWTEKALCHCTHYHDYLQHI